MAKNIIVYDLETQKTFADVNNQIDQLLVSFLGLYSYQQQQYYSFYERDLLKLEKILLQEQPLVIGFNSIHFDNTVLQPYFKTLRLADLPQLDILQDIHKALGFRMKLESVAQATLGEGKSGTGLDAIRYFREENWTALAKYCLDDVRITKEVYDYGCAQGFILYTSSGELRRMPVRWSDQPKITELVEQAQQTHRRLHIQYNVLAETTSRTVLETDLDIFAIEKTMVDVYCHTTQQRCRYDLNRFLSASLTEQRFSYQASLL